MWATSASSIASWLIVLSYNSRAQSASERGFPLGVCAIEQPFQIVLFEVGIANATPRSRRLKVAAVRG
jgi:hypothetical protein